MEKEGLKGRKSSSQSRCFGKSLTMRLPRSKFRDKLRMRQSKSADRLDLKCMSDCEINSDLCGSCDTDAVLQFGSSQCCKCGLKQNTNFHNTHGWQDRLTQSSSPMFQSESCTSHLSVASESSETGSHKYMYQCGHCSANELPPSKTEFCKKEIGTEKNVLGQIELDRKEPSAPGVELLDGDVYTSRKGTSVF